jgi:hypothetical protein
MYKVPRVVSERQRETARNSVSVSLRAIGKVPREVRLGELHGRCATFTKVPRVVSVSPLAKRNCTAGVQHLLFYTIIPIHAVH